MHRFFRRNPQRIPSVEYIYKPTNNWDPIGPTRDRTTIIIVVFSLGHE